MPDQDKDSQSNHNYISETHEWRYIKDIRIGDLVHRWGDDLEVFGVSKSGRGWTVRVKETDGTFKDWDYKKLDGQLICKIREN